jgi:hypothetical protein
VRNSGGGSHCLSLSGTNVSVLDSSVSGCAGGGISAAGGDARTLTRANITIQGNTMANFSRIVRTYRGGLNFDGVGLYVANNSISNAPHAGLTGGGSFHLFEFNTLSHILYESIDAGAFYVGRSFAQRGNVVRFNTFDTVRPTERLAQASCSQNAFYLDDEMSGYEFYGNLIKNATNGALLGGGRDNFIHSNHFEACDSDIHFDDRGLNWQSKSCQRNCTLTMGTSTTSCLYNALRDVNYTSPPWSTTFPKVVDIYDYHPCTPVGNTIEDNTYCHDGSKGGGQFLDRSEQTIQSWLSSVSNNGPKCGSESREPLSGVVGAGVTAAAARRLESHNVALRKRSYQRSH